MDQAKSRIEEALARIEAAAARPPSGSEGGWNANRELKTKVSAVLGELDLLIADLER